MKTSEVLKLAKQQVSTCFDDDRERYICNAIDDFSDHYGYSREDVRRVKSIIDRRLNGCPTLEHWLLKHHGISHNDHRNYVHYFRKMQDTRHAWLDSMIAEFTAKGD